MSDQRPDPDALLRRVAGEEARASRGRLKVFFGASPGVGKTYAMLEAARARKAEGVDVVVGWVETHGRRETAARPQLDETARSLAYILLARYPPPRRIDHSILPPLAHYAVHAPIATDWNP